MRRARDNIDERLYFALNFSAEVDNGSAKDVPSQVFANCCEPPHHLCLNKRLIPSCTEQTYCL